MRGTGQTAALTLVVTALFLAVLVGAAVPLFSGGQGGPERDTGWTPPPRTATPTRGAQNTPRPLATVPPVVAKAATLTPARTPTPTLTPQSIAALPSASPTATFTLSPVEATEAATSAPASLTAAPMAAPSLTPTETPTLLPEPTETLTATPTQPVPALPPVLIEPSDGMAAQGVITFRWQPSGPLLPGAGYEVVWWNPDEPPQAARGLAAPTQKLSLQANIDVLFMSNQAPGDRFFWTVLVVSENPYVRLTQPQDSPQHVLAR